VSNATAGSSAITRRSGTIAIVATIVVLAILGAVGLWRGLTAPLTVVGTPWALLTAGIWAGYGALLLLLFVRPARRAHLLVLGTVLALVWGGLAATEIAARANGAMEQIVANVSATFDSDWSNVFVAPFIEETLKMLGILLLAFLPAARRSGATAGLVFGALVGAGFQVVENEVFTLQELFKAGGPSGAVLLETFFIRGIVGVFSHIVFSGAIGAAIGWTLTAPRSDRLRRIAMTVGVFILMLGLHSWSNWTALEGQGIMYILTMTVGLVVLIFTMRFARSHSPTTDDTPEA